MQHALEIAALILLGLVAFMNALAIRILAHRLRALSLRLAAMENAEVTIVLREIDPETMTGPETVARKPPLH